MPRKTSEKQTEQTTEQAGPEDQSDNILVGYARKSAAGAGLKLSLNVSAFTDCRQYTTSDGQSYVPLVMSIAALRKVLEGERAVTTISQLSD